MNTWKGQKNIKYFFDFAEKHLFKKQESEKLTSFGKFLGAKKVELSEKFRAVNPRLVNIRLPYTNGASFKFSVHIIEFIKP